MCETKDSVLCRFCVDPISTATIAASTTYCCTTSNMSLSATGLSRFARAAVGSKRAAAATASAAVAGADASAPAPPSVRRRRVDLSVDDSKTERASVGTANSAVNGEAPIASAAEFAALPCSRTPQSGTWLVPLVKESSDVALMSEGSSGDSSMSGRPASAAPLWPSHYANIASMRAACDAPVDSMGCERCADAGADEHTKRFQTLVSLMLSSQVGLPCHQAKLWKLLAV